MLIQVFELVLVHGRDPVNASTIWNFKKIDRFWRSKFSLWPSPVKRDDCFDRLFPCSDVAVIEYLWCKVLASSGWIIFFACSDECFDDIDNFGTNFRFFRRRETISSAPLLNRLTGRESLEAKQDRCGPQQKPKQPGV